MAAPAPMSRDEVDFAMVGIVAAHDRVSAAMYAIDTHPGLVVLRGNDLRAMTRQVATATLQQVDVLWSQYAGLGAVVDRAKTVRAERARPGAEELAELTFLLRGPALALGPNGMVLDDPLAGPPPNWVTVMALARELENSSATVIETLDRVRAAHDELADQFTRLTKALDDVRRTAETLGDGVIEVGRIDARVAEATVEAMRDPLGSAGPPPGLAADIDALAAWLTGLARLRDGYPERVQELRVSIETVAEAQAAAVGVYAVVEEKIANPGLPAVPDAAPALRAHLAQLDQLYREKRWQRLATELSALERSVAEAQQRAAYVREAADGLLRRRAELRGRLDAHRARAARLGLVEHAELAARHRTAQDLLYTRPCDLSAATRAVVAYQRSLNDLTERGHR